MSEPTRPPIDPLPTVADDLCDHFEAAWRAGQRPRIEDFLARGPDAERRRLLLELLFLDLHYRRRAGERPGPQEYRARFPDDAEVLAAAFADSEPNDGDTGPNASAAAEAALPERLGR
jgi:hypothetical protein